MCYDSFSFRTTGGLFVNAMSELYTKIEGVDYLAMNEVYDDRMILDWKDADGACCMYPFHLVSEALREDVSGHVL